MTRSLNKLKDYELKAAKPRSKAYRMTDGGGLHLLINPDGSKYWHLRYRFNGTESTLSLGVYPEVTLTQARNKRDEERARLAQGINPSEYRKSKKVIMKKEIYAWITEGEGEGIAAGMINGMWMPLVSMDKRLAKVMEPFAKKISKESGKKINLYKFSQCEVIK